MKSNIVDNHCIKAAVDRDMHGKYTFAVDLGRRR